MFTIFRNIVIYKNNNNASDLFNRFILSRRLTIIKLTTQEQNLTTQEQKLTTQEQKLTDLTMKIQSLCKLSATRTVLRLKYTKRNPNILTPFVRILSKY